jgi:hypothetical protein
VTHRALNSSKVSSWCSARMRVVVLKLLEEIRLGRTRPARAARGWGRLASVFARKKVLGAPRAATRTSEADIWGDTGELGRSGEVHVERVRALLRPLVRNFNWEAWRCGGSTSSTE